jgi:hypothetical protein
MRQPSAAPQPIASRFCEAVHHDQAEPKNLRVLRAMSLLSRNSELEFKLDAQK